MSSTTPTDAPLIVDQPTTTTVKKSRKRSRPVEPSTPKAEGSKRRKKKVDRKSYNYVPKVTCPYIMYSTNNRPRIKKKYEAELSKLDGKARFAQIAKYVGAEWNKLSEDDPEKVRCNELSAQDAVQKKILRDILKNDPIEDYPDEYGLKIPRKRRKARNNWLIFSIENRKTYQDKNTELNSKEIQSLMSKDWNSFPEEKREVYSERYRGECQLNEDHFSARMVDYNKQRSLAAIALAAAAVADPSTTVTA